MIRSGLGTGRMNKADAQGTAGRLSAIVANSLDTQAETQDLARLANQSRTQFHRLFRTVKKLREPCDDGYRWKEPHINWRTREYRSRRLPWTPTTVRWRHSLVLSEELFGLPRASIGACVIRTFICRRPTKFTFLPLSPQQKEEEKWIYSIVLQATSPGTRAVCWNTRVLLQKSNWISRCP